MPGDREQPSRPKRQTGADAEYVQYMSGGDAATGANTAYGNSPRNSGARLVAAKPENEQPADRQ